jgi:hypothetical protein
MGCLRQVDVDVFASSARSSEVIMLSMIAG